MKTLTKTMTRRWVAGVVLACFLMSSVSSVFAATCPGNDKVQERMENAMKLYDDKTEIVMKETIQEPDWGGLDDCLSAIEMFDINSVLNFSLAGLLGGLIGNFIKNFLQDICNMLVGIL